MTNQKLIFPDQLVNQFTYLDCGSQGDLGNPLLSIFVNPKYIGFDPELSQPAEKNKSIFCFPVAVGKDNGVNKFYRTKNLNCSSFFVPDHDFLERFMQVGDFFQVQNAIQLRVVPLDEYLPQNDIDDIDFMELDTQGSELNILKGAETFLSSTVLGIRVEVEFYPIYQNQPLFSEVDAYLRKFGFMLFDLERYHLRRKTAPVDGTGREQIVWGQALYFKDWKAGTIVLSKQKLIKLAMMASFYGFQSYAFEIVEYMLNTDVSVLTTAEKEEVRNVYYQSIASRQLTLKEHIFQVTGNFQQCIRSLFKESSGRLGTPSKSSYFWKD